MIRIYLDKQIFSYLRKADKPEYIKLLSDLYEYGDNFLYCYSHAHLLDLQSDKSDIKYVDLDFMRTLVNDNYLSYHATEEKTSCYLATPRQAFDDLNEYVEPIDFRNLFDIDLDYITKEQKEQFEEAKDFLANQKIDFGFSQIQNLPHNISAPISKLLPIGVESMTLMDLMDYFMDTMKKIEEDKSIYKGLRNMIYENINIAKFTIDINNVDFDNSLKKSVLQKTFTEFVSDIINPNGDKKVNEYEFFINAYFSLDLLGISKESSKNVKFRNMMNDGFHSYYGAFCDYIISNDEGFIKKSEIMYKLLNIKTKVIHIDEFMQSSKLLSYTSEHELNTFFDLLENDLKSGIVLNRKSSIRYDREVITIKPYHSYLGYFNMIDIVTEKRRNYTLLYHTSDNYSTFYFYREIQSIVNKAVKVFGIDSNYLGNYAWDEENESVHQNTWKGRFWIFGQSEILLEFNKGTHMLTLSISPS